MLSGLGDGDGVVVGDAIDELIDGVDASAGWKLVDDDLEGVLLLGNLFLLEVEGLFVVLLPGEDADVDVVGEGHGGFVA